MLFELFLTTAAAAVFFAAAAGVDAQKCIQSAKSDKGGDTETRAKDYQGKTELAGDDAAEIQSNQNYRDDEANGAVR